MNRIILIVGLFMMYCSAEAQITFGMKAGVSSLELADRDMLINAGEQKKLTLTLQEASYGYHFGVFTRVKLFGIFLEPSFIFNSSELSYNISEEIFDTGVINTIKTEKYQNLDIPLMFGIKAGFINLHAGPVAHLHLNSVSELTELDGYKQKFKDATYGYQIGFGVELAKLGFEVNYEGNLSNFGNHINIGDESYSFDDKPSRLIGTVFYKF